MLDLSKVKLTGQDFPAERARVRPVRLDDPEEIKRLWEIERDEMVERYVEDLSSSEEDLRLFSVSDRNYLVLAIEGKEGHVDMAEVGKLQGWLIFYPEKKWRLRRLKQVGMADFWSGEERILEVGFARHPLAKSGQVASALRQAVRLLIEEHKKEGLSLVITAYTDEANEASRRVLIAAGFSQAGKIKYHAKNKTEDHFFVLS